MHLRTSRAAAQSLNHIWISDDVLAEAFNRFVRVSHTCRRYGSNVPGPLEARRRQGKRRMGLAAHEPSGAVPMGDFRGLFGLGTPRTDWEHEWKWQPPSHNMPPIQIGVPPPPAPLPAVFWSRSAESSQQAQHQRLDQIVEPSPDPIATSTEAFQALLQATADVKLLDGDDLKNILDFLQTSADEPDSQNFIRLADWLSSRSLTGAAMESILDTVYSKVRLQTFSDNSQIASVIARLIQHGSAPDSAASFTQVLDAVPKWSIVDVVKKVTRKLTLCLTDLEHPALRDLTRLWLDILHCCAHMQGEQTQPTWSFIYNRVAAKIPVPDLCDHLGTLPRREFVRVLLQHWLPTYMDEHVANSRVEPPSISEGGYRLRVLPIKEFGKFQAVIDEFESLSSKHDDGNTSQERDVEHDASLTEMLMTLDNHQIPHERLLGDVFTVLKATASPLTVWRLFRDCYLRLKLGMSEETAVDLISYFLQTGNRTDLRHAYRIFDVVKTISAIQCSQLPVELIKHGYGTPERISTILNRRSLHGNVSAEERSVSNLAITNAHVNLVELVAFTYANSRRISSRVAFRRVWECFRFLQDRSAPMSPLMSRAMVRAGIARAMQYDNAYVPRTQIQYIISVVNRIEGPEVASKLDYLVFNIKKTRFFDPNGADMIARRIRWAHEHDSKLAKRAQWRLRRWTRKQSSPWFTMQSIKDGRRPPGDRDQVHLHEGSDNAQLTTMAADDPTMATLRQQIDENVTRENAAGEAQQDLWDEGEGDLESAQALVQGSSCDIKTTTADMARDSVASSVDAVHKHKGRNEDMLVAFQPFSAQAA